MIKFIVELTNFTKIYKSDHINVTALFDIDLAIKKGEFAAIMGPSGSGKSTLLNLIGCLDKPTSGTYLLDNENIKLKNFNNPTECRISSTYNASRVGLCRACLPLSPEFGHNNPEIS